LTDCLCLAAITDAAGFAVIPPANRNTPYGQQFCYAAPGAAMGNLFIGTPSGVPLAEMRLLPGMAVASGSKAGALRRARLRPR
jgi:L-rhamnonate dehydratase